MSQRQCFGRDSIAGLGPSLGSIPRALAVWIHASVGGDGSREFCARRLACSSHGRDSRTVNPGHERKGMSAETTFNEDLTAAADLEAELWPL